MDPSVALRSEVRRFVTSCGTTRALPSLVHVGVLGGARITVVPDPWYDAGLRSDLLTRALDRLGHRGVSTWLTRGGHLTVGDADLAWLAAAAAAFGRHGLDDAPFHVITRYGWLDPRSGEHRSWRRVRALPRTG